MAEESSSKSSPETGSKGGGSAPSGLLGKYKSKKQSATGHWDNDTDVTACRKCETKFSFTVRKHHCRMCGRIFCGSCCNNQILMEELSRSGKPKRVCDWCFAKERGLDETDALEETEEERISDLNISEDQRQTSTASSHEEGSAVSATPHEAARLAHGIQEISQEEAVESLNHVQFSGRWLMTLTFHVVDMKNSPNVGPPLKAAPADAFRGPAPGGRGGKKRRSTRPDAATLKPGSSRRAVMELYPKGKAYFKGVCKELAPFGKDGKITGSIQQRNGQVSMQMQLKSANGVTTSFNLIGRMNKEGSYIGTFSGCEIAKSAGAVSGTFQAAAMEEEISSEESSDNEKSRGKSTAPRGSATATRKSSADDKSRRSSSKDGGENAGSQDKKSSQEDIGEAEAAATSGSANESNNDETPDDDNANEPTTSESNQYDTGDDANANEPGNTASETTGGEQVTEEPVQSSSAVNGEDEENAANEEQNEAADNEAQADTEDKDIDQAAGAAEETQEESTDKEENTEHKNDDSGAAETQESSVTEDKNDDSGAADAQGESAANEGGTEDNNDDSGAAAPEESQEESAANEAGTEDKNDDSGAAAPEESQEESAANGETHEASNTADEGEEKPSEEAADDSQKQETE